jgi:hypothetical protein
MPALTDEEKQQGRHFRDAQHAALERLNQEQPPTYLVPNFLKHYRHLCPKRQSRSTAMALKEVYVFSDFTSKDEDGIDRPRLGWIYKEGVCSGCRQTARSRTGKVVDAWERPPAEGRVAR